jgi:RNA polymerase sigma factor (sigma-70 family)
MTAIHVRRWIQGLRVLAGDASQVRDEELVQELESAQSEPAFAVLVRRHGPLVLNVCRRVLGHDHDAEDAFQATFLVLARRAKSIRKVSSLAAWLHGVAYRVALKMKVDSFRRQRRERLATTRLELELPADMSMREVGVIVHEEIERLPETQRQPLLLCYFEGLSQEEAAQQLGWPRGTLKRRFERGRDRLRKVLQRRGLALGVPVVAGLFADFASAAVPSALSEVTVKSGVLAFAGKELPSSLVSQQVVSTVRKILRSMWLSQLGTMVMSFTCLVLVAGAGAGAWVRAASCSAATPPGAKQRTAQVFTAAVTDRAARSSGSVSQSNESTDKEEFIGTWRVVGGEAPGFPMEKFSFENVKLTFKYETVKWHADQGGFDLGYQLHSRKQPGEIDMGGGAGGRIPPMVGVYKFEGKKLFLALAPVNRPKDVVTTAKSDFFVYELERVENDEDAQK